jgi:hypothetical protein
MCTCTEGSLGRHIYHTAQDIHKMAGKILSPYGFTVEQMHLLKECPSIRELPQRPSAG